MKVAAFLALIAALPGAGSASTANPVLVLHPTSSVAIQGFDGRLDADGRRAAAIGGCGIDLWKPGARKTTFVQPCRYTRRVDFAGVDEVALAGDRLAWIREESISHGMRFQTELVVKAGSRKAREIASAYDDSGFGAYLIGLDGDGDTLAFAWHYSFDEDVQEQVFRISRTDDAGACPVESDGLLPNPPQAFFCVDTSLPLGSVESVSQGRILVSFGDLLGVVERDNSEHDLPIPFSVDDDVAVLAGAEVVVVHERGSTLDVYDSLTGSSSKRWPIPLAAEIGPVSVAGGFAVYSSNGIRLVRLRDGRIRKLQIPRGKRPVAAALEPAGLFVLYRTKHGERLGFVPMQRLRKW